MKIKVDITDKEKNILYRLFTLILIIINLIVTYYSTRSNSQTTIPTSYRFHNPTI